MRRDPRAYLWEVVHAAESIQSFTAGKTIESYLADELLRSAVERKFGIIGEALSQLLRHFPDYRNSISVVASIVAFRNQLIHGYATVQDDIV